jgi:hypothetical protein
MRILTAGERVRNKGSRQPTEDTAGVVFQPAMRLSFNLLLTLVITGCSMSLQAQDLAPRAYVITPVHSNAVTLTYALYDGNIQLDGAVPITDASATVHVPVFTLYHSLNFFGRSANILASLPYGVGDFQGTVVTTQTTVHRSGLLDSTYRFSVNLKGGPAMNTPEMREWRQTTLIGFSFKVVAPTGQYDPTKLVNFGTNRWAFKPEIGLSKRWRNWVLDTYGGVWFYTTNNEYYSHNQVYPGVRSQTQAPIAAFEGHLSYDLKPRLWASLDGNFWFGGSTSVNGVENPDTQQRNSRIGGTLSYPLGRHQSVKVSYSRGDYIRFGGNYNNLSLAWQYSWTGWPK